MRNRSIRGLTCVALATTAATMTWVAGFASAQEPARVEVTIEPPAALTVGGTASVITVVRIVPVGNHPILLTPSSEGTAVEVVRGRLLRADAEDPAAEVLRFSIPIVARTLGTSVLRVHVSGWACEERCRPVESDAEIVLRVARRPVAP